LAIYEKIKLCHHWWCFNSFPTKKFFMLLRYIIYISF
jgi:hypothetical protein